MLLALVLAAAPLELKVGQWQPMPQACDRVEAGSANVGVRREAGAWILVGVKEGAGSVRCVVGKQATTRAVVVRRAPSLRDLAQVFRCSSEAPQVLVRAGRAELLRFDPALLPAGVPADALAEVLPAPRFVHRLGGPPRPSEQVIRELAATIESWPGRGEHLTITLDDESREVQVLGAAMSEDEVQRVEQLAQAYRTVGFDVRLFDARSCTRDGG